MQRVRALTTVAAAIAVILSGACGRSEAPAPASPAPQVSKSPIGFLDTPKENQVIAPGTFVSGWALHESGVADISVVFDDGQKSSVRRGDNFPGVAAQYSSYPEADKAGYVFAIPKLNPGPHVLTVTVRARDGSTAQIVRRFSAS